MECPNCKELLDDMGLGANPKGGRISSILFCSTCDKHFRAKENPDPFAEQKAGKPGRISRGIKKVKESKIVSVPSSKFAEATPKIKAVAKAAGIAAAGTGLRAAAAEIEGKDYKPFGASSMSGGSPFRSWGDYKYNDGPALGGGQVQPKAMFIPERDEQGNIVKDENGKQKGKWVNKGDPGYIDPPDDFWRGTGGFGGGGRRGGGSGAADAAKALIAGLGDLKGLDPATLKKVMNIIPTIALIDGAVEVLQGPGGQKLLGSVGEGVGKGVWELVGKEGLAGSMKAMATSEAVQTGAGKTIGATGELIGKEGAGRLIGEGATGLVGSIGTLVEAPTRRSEQAMAGGFGLAGSGLGLIGQKQSQAHELEMAKLGYGPGRSNPCSRKNPSTTDRITEGVVTSPFRERYMNPKEETFEQYLTRLATTNKSSKEDGVLMQGMLRGKLGFPGAIVTSGVVYLEGQGTLEAPPTSVNAIAIIILNQIGLEKKKATGGGKK